MSELKAVHAFDVYEAYTKTGNDDAAQVYLKSEADMVIAELEESHKMEVEQLLIEIAELKDEIKRLENVRKVHIESIESMCEGLKLNAKQICKTQRALWLARAERAKEMCQRLLIQGFDPKWEEVERKCRAKAEEYK